MKNLNMTIVFATVILLVIIFVARLEKFGIGWVVALSVIGVILFWVLFLLPVMKKLGSASVWVIIGFFGNMICLFILPMTYQDCILKERK